MARIAILGGTGPEGLGLAMRWAQAGEEISIGSRDPKRAVEAAAKVAAAVKSARVGGDVNEALLAGADYIVLSFPFEGLRPFMAASADKLAGKMVIDIINPLQVKKGVFSVPPVPEGSAGELAQQLAPQARVVGAFKTLSAERLQELDHPMEGDAILCGDDEGAKQAVAELARRIPNLRPVDAGTMINSRYIEGITAMLLNVNKRYKAHAAIQVVGI